MMFGKSLWKTQISSVTDKASKQIKKFGILNSTIGDFLKRVDGEKLSLPLESETSTEIYSSTLSDESIKK